MHVSGLPGGWVVNNPSASAGDTASIPGSGRSPGVGMASESSILAWKIPWTEEPGGAWRPWGHRELDTTVQLRTSGIPASGHCDHVTACVYHVSSASILVSGFFIQTDMQTRVSWPPHPRFSHLILLTVITVLYKLQCIFRAPTYKNVFISLTYKVQIGGNKTWFLWKLRRHSIVFYFLLLMNNLILSWLVFCSFLNSRNAFRYHYWLLSMKYIFPRSENFSNVVPLIIASSDCLYFFLTISHLIQRLMYFCRTL